MSSGARRLTREGCQDRTARLLRRCSEENVDLAVISNEKEIYYFSNYLRKPFGWLQTRVCLWGCFRDGTTFLLCSRSESTTMGDVYVDHVVTYADYDIQASTQTFLEDGLQALPLELGGVGLRDARLDDRPAAIGRNDAGQARLFVEGRGRHRLTLEMVTPLQTSAAQQSLDFRLPAAPAAQLRLTVPGNVDAQRRLAVEPLGQTPGKAGSDVLNHQDGYRIVAGQRSQHPGQGRWTAGRRGDADNSHLFDPVPGDRRRNRRLGGLLISGDGSRCPLLGTRAPGLDRK